MNVNWRSDIDLRSKCKKENHSEQTENIFYMQVAGLQDYCMPSDESTVSSNLS